MNVDCPRCGKTCPVGHQQSAHCSACFTSFRADDPAVCLTPDEQQQAAAEYGRLARGC